MNKKSHITLATAAKRFRVSEERLARLMFFFDIKPLRVGPLMLYTVADVEMALEADS